MPEFFIVANSNAAPFCSDQSTHYVEGPSPDAALVDFAADYSHPCGLYNAAAYYSADAFHKSERPASRWFSPKALRDHSERIALGRGQLLPG